MTDRSDVIAELASELGTITASPELAARVRARIGERPAGWTPRWRLACAWAGVLAIVAAVLPVPGLRFEQTTPIVARPVELPPAAPSSPVAAVAGNRVVGSESRSLPERRPRRDLRVVRAPAADSIFEVITNQAAVLSELWRVASASQTPASGDLPVVAVATGIDGSILVPDIVVEPIVVLPIGGAAAGAPGRIQRVTSPQATGSPR